MDILGSKKIASKGPTTSICNQPSNIIVRTKPAAFSQVKKKHTSEVNMKFWANLAPMSSGRFWSQWFLLLNHHETLKNKLIDLDLLVWWLENIKTYSPNGGARWWFTMVEALKISRQKNKKHTHINIYIYKYIYIGGVGGWIFAPNWGWDVKWHRIQSLHHLPSIRLPPPRKKHMQQKILKQFLHVCSSWWFQPLWKIWVKMGKSSPNRGENQKYLKPPPSCWLTHLRWPWNQRDTVTIASQNFVTK